ncbi:hypothetical protein [Devosia nitrariae]|uniref:Tat pathway signal sequence domain protein n=1 Tax=Devosia nitrariae TaxID=2071872 RepID=A0ABQ5WEK3_9HYPH|nr:hypothetical protein [Devosia nitrariae]GLQ58021.1 hypothetical protein GCM10010862_52800 [Devosia nitrariae]
MRTIRALAAAGALLACLGVPARAQDAESPAGALYVQLNNVQTVGADCQLTFVMRNQTGETITRSAYNMAIIDVDGQVSTLITFEFLPLPAGDTKVQQFALAGQSCEALSGLLVNEVVTCETPAGKSELCAADLRQSSRVDVAFPWDLEVDF